MVDKSIRQPQGKRMLNLVKKEREWERLQSHCNRHSLLHDLRESYATFIFSIESADFSNYIPQPADLKKEIKSLIWTCRNCAHAIQRGHDYVNLFLRKWKWLLFKLVGDTEQVEISLFMLIIGKSENVMNFNDRGEIRFTCSICAFDRRILQSSIKAISFVTTPATSADILFNPLAWEGKKKVNNILNKLKWTGLERICYIPTYFWGKAFKRQRNCFHHARHPIENII